jgi:hypothetical protein
MRASSAFASPPIFTSATIGVLSPALTVSDCHTDVAYSR